MLATTTMSDKNVAEKHVLQKHKNVSCASARDMLKEQLGLYAENYNKCYPNVLNVDPVPTHSK